MGMQQENFKNAATGLTALPLGADMTTSPIVLQGNEARVHFNADGATTRAGTLVVQVNDFPDKLDDNDFWESIYFFNPSSGANVASVAIAASTLANESIPIEAGHYACRLKYTYSSGDTENALAKCSIIRETARSR